MERRPHWSCFTDQAPPDGTGRSGEVGRQMNRQKKEWVEEEAAATMRDSLPILQAHVETNLDPIPASLIFVIVRKRENKCPRFRSNDECR